jgi:hypothetical protein
MKKILSILVIASLMLSMMLFAPLIHAEGATIWTDKDNYGPDETVTIFGSGFLADAEVTITITAPDLSVATIYAWTDGLGAFTAQHVLNGMEGTYNATATDGTNTATTTFTEAIRIRTYKDAAYATEETVFVQGDTVYAKATGLSTSKYYKIEWFDPSDVSKKATVYGTGATSRTDFYTLSSAAPIGAWKVKVYEGSSSTGPWGTAKDTATFYVWHLIAPTADSWVESENPTKNYGSDEDLHVKVELDHSVENLRRTYLKFDLSGLPSGAVIDSAILHLYRTTGAQIPSAYKTTDAWTEMGIKWNNQPGPGDFVADGALGSAWIHWDITSYAASEFAGDKILSTVLKFKTESGSDQHADFTSREGTWNQRPWLEISYHTPPPEVDITITSSPVTGSGFVKVDDTPITTPTTFTWTIGATHKLEALSPVAGPPGTRYVWTSWSDGGVITHNIIVPNTPTTYTAYFKTQYQVTVTASPAGAVGGTFFVTYTQCGTTYTNVVETTTWTEWIDAGTTVTVSSPEDPIYDGPVTKYVFDHYDPSASVTMTGPTTIALVYTTQYYLTVVSPYDTPGGEGWYDEGDSAYATLATGTVDITPGWVRAVFTGWTGDASGTGLTSDSITMDGPKTAVANWEIQYYLDVVTDPSHLPPIPGAEWYDNCTWVRLTAPQYVPDEAGEGGVRYVFSYWDVDGTSQGMGVNPIDIHMNASHIATAHFVTQYNVTFDQTGLDGTAVGTVVTFDSQTKAYGDLPFSMWVDNGTSVSYVYETVVSSSVSGKRFRLDSVTDPASPITVTSPVTVTGNYVIQYYLTLATSPPSVNAPTGEGWYDAETYASISTSQYVDIVPGSSRYRFNGWTTAELLEITDPSATSTTVLMDNAKTVTANYVTQYNITFDQTGVGSDFTGTVVVIDVANYGVSALPVSFWYDNGSTHNFAFQSPLVVPPGAKQYDWASTSGLSALQSGSITVTGSGSITGNYVTRVHDVAVTNLVAIIRHCKWGNGTWVFQGRPINFNVTVENNGDFDEALTVTLYYNITANEIIGTQNTTLLIGESKTLSFVWNTASVPYCHNYTITAVATIPADYTPADNTLDNVYIKIRIMGDLNGDGKVDMKDIRESARSFASYGPDYLYPGSPPHPRWNLDCDINEDNKVDCKDLRVVAKNFGMCAQ